MGASLRVARLVQGLSLRAVVGYFTGAPMTEAAGDGVAHGPGSPRRAMDAVAGGDSTVPNG